MFRFKANAFNFMGDFFHAKSKHLIIAVILLDTEHK